MRGTSFAVAALAAALAILVARPVPARACTCVDSGILVLPRSGVAAPTNTRVRVLFPEYETWRKHLGVQDGDVTVGIRTEASARAAPAKKGKKGEAAAVDVDRVDLGSGDLRIMELTPKAELKAKTRYQVVVSVSGGKQEVVGEFTTGEGPDTVAPTFTGISKARVQLDDLVDSCSSGAAYARLVLGDVGDEGGPGKDALVYGLWIAGDDGKVAYDRPPATYLLARAGKLFVGQVSACGAKGYTLPRDAKSLIVGIRVIDLAGNKAETAGEVVLDLSKIVRSATD